MRFLPAALLSLIGLSAAGAAIVQHELRLPQPAQEPDAPAAEAQEEEKADPEEIRRELGAAQRELELAHAKGDLARLESAAEEMRAAVALEAAQAALIAFESHAQAARVASSELQLKREQDGADDARDEMEQLAALYGEGDLADRTAEIVLRRAQRGLERAEESLRLARAEHHHLTTLVLQREQIELRAAVREGEMEVRRIETQRRVSELEGRNGIAALEEKIAGLQKDLERALAPAAVAK